MEIFEVVNEIIAMSKITHEENELLVFLINYACKFQKTLLL